MNLHHRSHRSRPIRSLFLIVAATLLLAASQFTGGAAQTTHQQLALGYLEMVQGGSASSLVSPHSVLHTPEGSYAGIDGPARFGAELQESFSNLSFSTRGASSVGEFVMIEFTLTGLHTGAYLNMPPQCAGVSTPALAILHVEDSGITQQWISYDRGDLLAQIDTFSQFDAYFQHPCDSQGQNQSEPAVASRPPCLALNACSYMP